MVATRSHQSDTRDLDINAIVPLMRPGKDEVMIRMYGQGVGDCFLLAFPRTQATHALTADADRPVYVVIDCGVITGTPDGSRRMKRIVRDIRLTTQGHLDLLILTHEHWDHLSGFIDARDEW